MKNQIPPGLPAGGIQVHLERAKIAEIVRYHDFSRVEVQFPPSPAAKLGRN